MKFRVEIDCDNAAFAEFWSENVEVARILKGVVSDLHRHEKLLFERHPLKDRNGNTVGYWEYVKD